MSRYAELVKRFKEAVLEGSARLSPVVRRAAFDGAPAGTDTVTYLEKLRRHAYQVTDEDIAALRAAGWTDETIYELSVAAAVGQGMRRLDLGMAALAAARAKDVK